MQRSQRTRLGVGLIAAVVIAMAIAPGASASTFTYRLHNHPDGAQAMPGYGLRLDELLDVTDDHDIFTFDFDDANAMMQLVYDDGGTAGDGALGDDSVRIFGTVYGGLDVGDSYDTGDYAGLWDVDFTYTANFAGAGAGGSNVTIGADSPLNTGSITPLFDLGTTQRGVGFGLVDEDGGMDFSFKFNNVDDHRLDGYGMGGPDTFVGWGWLNHSGQPHVYSSDWLFTGEKVEPVPEPATLVLLTMGLAGGVASRRRKSKTQS